MADLVLAATALTMTALGRRYGLNLGLLALVAALAALAWFEPAQEQSDAKASLPALPAEGVERIAVERPGQSGLLFERRAGVWWLTAPEQGPANPILIRSLLQLTETHCAPSYPVAALDVIGAGLEPPRLRLWFNEQEIHFGGTAPSDGRRYLRVGGTVHLCPDRWLPLLTSAAGSFLAAPLQPAATVRD